MKFKEYLEIKNTSLKRISDECNIPYATLYNGVKSPDKMNLKNFNKLSEHLEISKDDLFTMLLETNKLTLLSILLDQKESNLKGNIYHFTQINFAYNTNRIEGSKLTEEQTRLIYDTSTLGEIKDTTNIDDIIETSNSFYLFDVMLHDNNSILTETIIKNYHKILKNGTSDSRKQWFNVGEYKLLPNEVGGKDTSSPVKVKSDMKSLLKWYNSLNTVNIEDIIEFHYRFEMIHPFQDGNGRIGRIIIFRECLRNNLIPFFINDNKKSLYYRGLSKYKEEKGYLIDTCLSMQDLYFSSIKKYLQSLYEVNTLFID